LVPGTEQLDLNPFANSASTEPERLSADLDASGEVNFADFLLFALEFGKESSEPLNGDLHNDGVVDSVDFLLFAEQFGRRQEAI